MNLMQSLKSFLRAEGFKALLYTARDADSAEAVGPDNPLPVALTAGATISDPDSAREATLLQVLTALLALGGNTDGLEVLATQQKAVLDQMAAYVNDVEGLLTLIGNSTDGLEGLLNALGVKDDNVLAKLTEILAKDEQIRALLAGTLAISAAALPLPTGASTEATLASQKLVIDAIKARLDLLAAKTDTQPVSLAVVPLPPGASTEATLAAQKAVVDLMKARLDLLATDAKSEQIRALLAGTLAISAAALPLPAGASTSALQTAMNTILTAIQTAVQGTLQVKANPDAPFYSPSVISAGASADAAQNIGARAITAITIGTGWTAADISFEHSFDGGANWFPIYDIYGNPLSYKAGAGRTIAVPPGDLMRRGTIRLRSGVPGGYINQTSAVAVTYTIVTL